MKKYALNASGLHKKVGEILTNSSPWKGIKSEQEVLVKEIFPEFHTGNERYDWVIKDLNVIIECHGKQHYEVATFGQEIGEAILNFKAQQRRDAKKQEIALLNNWIYIIIPYTDEKEITEEYIYEQYQKGSLEASKHEGKTSPRSKREQVKPKSKFEQDRLDTARAYRKERYEYLKALKKAK